MNPEKPEPREKGEREEFIDFGPCCACGKEDHTVRNILLLPRKAPVPATGWGCVICDLPADGLVAVVCDECLKIKKPLKFAILGLAADKKRIPMDEIAEEPFDHNELKHMIHDFAKLPAKGAV